VEMARNAAKSGTATRWRGEIMVGSGFIMDVLLLE
jgi:hypothetical protein